MGSKRTSIFAADERTAEREYKEKEHKFRTKFQRDRDRILYSREFRRLSGKTQVFVTGFDDHFRTRLTHTLEVSQIARTIARKLYLNDALTEAIALGHDVGHTPFGHVGERTLNLILSGCDPIKDFNKFLHETKNYDQRGFKHNWQSLRVLTELERVSSAYKGLNLTNYTLWGILNHSKLDWKSCGYCCEKDKCEKGTKCNLRHIAEPCWHDANSDALQKQDSIPESVDRSLHVTFYIKPTFIGIDSWTVEGLIVRWADEIAQRHHDIEDGLEAGIINKKELIELFTDNFSGAFVKSDRSLIKKIDKENIRELYMPLLSRFIVNFLATQIIAQTEENLEAIKKHYTLNSSHSFHKEKAQIYRDYDKPDSDESFCDNIVTYNPTVKSGDKKVQEYLRNRILLSSTAQRMDGKSDFIIRQIIKALLTNPQQLPNKTVLSLHDQLNTTSANQSKPISIGVARDWLKKKHNEENDDKYRNALLRTVCDHVAGMTDRYAVEQYNMLYGAGHSGRLANDDSDYPLS